MNLIELLICGRREIADLRETSDMQRRCLERMAQQTEKRVAAAAQAAAFAAVTCYQSQLTEVLRRTAGRCDLDGEYAIRMLAKELGIEL